MKKLILFFVVLLSIFFIADAAASTDPLWIVKQYEQSHPDIKAPIVYYTGSMTVSQFPLLNGRILLTVVTVTAIDSASTVSPAWSGSNPNTYFDASFYNHLNDSSESDSVLYAVTVNEPVSGTDSVRIRRLGAFSPNTTAASMDTLGSNKASIYEAVLNTHATKLTYMFPYWGFAIDGIACTSPTVRLYVFNITGKN